MKLYNLYKEIILEDVNSDSEGTIERAGADEEDKINSYQGSVESIINQLIQGERGKNGKKFFRSARIWYRDIKTKTLEERYVFIYGLGTTKHRSEQPGKYKPGRPAVRAYQAFGGTKTGNSKWKIFLLPGVDQKDGKQYGIQKIEVTDMKWYKPVDKLKGSTAEPYKGPNRDRSFYNGLELGVDFNK